MDPIFVSLGAFTIAATLLTITPGIDTALVLRIVAAGNARRAALAALGIAVGCFRWALLVALGLGALLAASQLVYTLLRWTGAAYLVWTGYKMLRIPRQSFLAANRDEHRAHSAFGTGALTNLLNPKVGVFYVSFLPQFVAHGVPVAPYILLLGALHALLGLIWFACLIVATRPIGVLLQRLAMVRTCDRATGAVFVGFGVHLALESRRG